MFYIETENKIILADDSKQKLVDTIKFMPQYQNLEIIETDKQIVFYEGEYYFEDDEIYIQKKKEEELNSHKQNILSKLEELDKKRIRAVCESGMKDDNITWLEYYNSKVEELREELSSL